jgi:hypothetical protein
MSFQARAFFLQGWGLIDLPVRAAFSPTHWHVSGCHEPGEGILIFHTCPKESRQTVLHCARRTTFILLNNPSKLARYSPPGDGLVDPQMRALNEHLLSVRVPRARRAPGHSFSQTLCPFTAPRGWPPIVLYCARPTRAFSGRALREHGGHRRSPPLPPF